MAEILPDGSFQGYRGYCPVCKKEVSMNMQGEILEEHICSIKKKIVYIAHPISGNIEENLRDIIRIVRYINLNFRDVSPQVPYYVDILALNDNYPEERARGIENDTAMIETGVYDELWLTGDNISFGMRKEIELFKKLGKPIANFIGQF